MCGIAGTVGRGADSRLLTPMLRSLSRRGPDSEGSADWSDAALGHRRLAIFDLSEAGHQPMLSPDRSVGIVFNGAIYNFHELRRDLVGSGYTFVSETDTEVLIHGYRAWGIEGLVDRLRGMFAFAIWDDRERKLFLVRDRLGVKPLLYARSGDRLAFASTVRALHEAGLAADLDPAAVAEFLQLGFVTERRSIYAGIEKLPPASIGEWSERGFSVRRYWSPPAQATALGISFDDAVAETERLLLRAVELRLHADVPVAALLSGGVDSSLVCWAIAQLGGDVTAFTAGTPGYEVDETDDALATAKMLGVRHQVLPLSDADDVGVPQLVAAYPEPFAVSSALGMLRLSRAIAETPARVVLTGDGGDDVFLGYPRHRLLLETQRVARKLPIAATGAWRGLRNLIPQRGALRRFTHLMDYTTGGLGGFVNASPGLRDFERHGLLGSRLQGLSFDSRPATWSMHSARNALADYLAYDRDMQFVSEYLVKVDGSTMHYALEARAPFLDHVLWEYASSLSFDVRMRGGTLKAVLREIVRRRIGARVASGSKRGFSIPVEMWMAKRWHANVAAAVDESLLVAEGWILQEPLRRELAAAAERGSASRRLWYFWVLEEWLRLERSSKESSRPAAAASALGSQPVRARGGQPSWQ